MANKDDEAKQLIKRVTEAKGDWFKILDIEVETATVKLVTDVYRKFAIKLHPDKCKVDGARDAFGEVNKAFENLKDPSVLARFQEASKKKKEKDSFKSKSVLEQMFRESRGPQAQDAKDPENKMATELSAEERLRQAEEDARKENLYKVERKHKEREERVKRKVMQREEDTYKEAELQETIGSWKAFQSGGGAKRRAAAPALKQDVGSVRTAPPSDIAKGIQAPVMDYKLLRKGWQDYTR
ncbi:chaperone protein DNAj [Diplonema papillatum]|nr:chaperone protein DNAj [Diplonema papillatum]